MIFHLLSFWLPISGFCFLHVAFMDEHGTVYTSTPMDVAQEIKARLPIEQLVGQYCQLKKKGRSFVCLCPFHNDSNPSFLVSPDKGIAYCFACNSGGDIFSFYQKIEGVDFPQALRDLADKAGVVLPEHEKMQHGPKKGEKDRARECLQAAVQFYREQLKKSELATKYLEKRAVPQEQIEQFGLGYAPDSFTVTYEHLLKLGFSRTEIVAAGLGGQKELDGKIYDRFRNRLMFPITDGQGQLVGFGGRTLGNDDAKYVNSPEGILYNKSQILFGHFQARDAIRETAEVVLVEGYFDVLACHRAGVKNVVAVSGTALTDQHAHLLRRTCKTVTLCLDQDRAGRAAADRAFTILSPEDILVCGAVLPGKDPAEIAEQDVNLLRQILTVEHPPYIDLLLADLRSQDLHAAPVKAAAIERLIPLLQSIGRPALQEETVSKAGNILNVDMKAELKHASQTGHTSHRPVWRDAGLAMKGDAYTRTEVTLGIFLLYPNLWHLLPQLIRPDVEFGAVLYDAMLTQKDLPERERPPLDLPQDMKDKVAILQLYCEEHGFADWSEANAIREINKNCLLANRELLDRKKEDVLRKMREAQVAGLADQERALAAEYGEVLVMRRKVG